MKKRWVFLIASLALIAGFITGGYAGIRFWQEFDTAALETRLMADARTRLAVLSSLKSANQDKAVDLLEIMLDGDVIGINAVIETSGRKAELRAVLSKIAQYRAESGYRSSEPQVASAVQQALEGAIGPNIAVKRDAPQAARPLP